ncbi:MAG: hypothetical protein AAFY60_17100 [Myxococcota bacterium]
MKKLIAFLGLTLAVALPNGLAFAQSGPVPFFPLVLQRDYAAAEELVEGNISVRPSQIESVGSTEFTPNEFLKRVSTCNVQDFYAKDETNETIVVWMCSLEPGANGDYLSKTILVYFEVDSESVRLWDYFERYDTRPAPPSRFRNAPVKTDG